MKFAVVFLLLAIAAYGSANIITNGVQAGIENIVDEAQRDMTESIDDIKELKNETNTFKKVKKLVAICAKFAKINAKVAYAVGNPVGYVAGKVLSGMKDQIFQKN